MLRAIEADHFRHYQYPNRPSLSGEGHLAYTLSTVDVEEDRYRTDLWVRFPGGETRRMTDFGDFGGFRWTSGHTLAFPRLLDEGERKRAEEGVPLSGYAELDVETGALRQLFTVHRRVTDMQPLSKGRFLLLCEVDPLEERLAAETAGDWDRFLKERERESHFIVAEEAPIWTDSSGLCGGKRNALFLLEGERLTRLTSESFQVYGFAPCEDQYALFHGAEYRDVCPTASQLYRIDGDSLEISAVPEDAGYVYGALCPLPGGTALVDRHDKRLHGEYQDEYLDRVDLATGAYQRLNGDCALHGYDSVNSDIAYGGGFQSRLRPLGGGVCFIGTKEGSSHLFYGDFETGTMEQITAPQGKVLDFDCRDGVFYAVTQRGLGGSELCRMTWDGSGPAREEPLTHLNDALPREWFQARPEELRYTTPDGTEICGWVLKPMGFDPAERYPAVCFIHGGPNTAYGPNFIHEMQYLACRGYGIFFCNPRGSVGHGGDFADIRFRYGLEDYTDIMGFVDAVLEGCPWIDGERLGVTGGSYGGIMTNWIVGHTQRFKAAISDRGNCNCISDFGLSDIGIPCGPDTYGVTPWEDHEKLWHWSPLKYAPEIKTPLLFVHGLLDYRCTADHAIQLFTALKWFGTDTRLFLMKDGNHGACRDGSPRTRIRRLEEMAAWLDRYLK